MPLRNRYSDPTTPYLQRSRAARKAAYIQLRNKIRRAAPVLGGRYYTPVYMDGKNGWLDLYFMGSRFPIFYTVAIQTTRHAYKEKVLDEAFRRAELLVPEKEKWWDESHLDAKSGMFVTPARFPRKYTDLGGLSRTEWVEAQQRVIADERIVQVHEQWEIRTDYHSGVGLHATLDVPHLTGQVVEDFIDRFMAHPGNYCSHQLLSFASSEIEDWGMEANTLVEPWDWHQIEP